MLKNTNLQQPTSPAPTMLDTGQCKSSVLTPSRAINAQVQSTPGITQHLATKHEASPDSLSADEQPGRPSSTTAGTRKRKLSHPMRSATKKKVPSEAPCVTCRTLVDDVRRDKASLEEQLRLMQGKHRDLAAKHDSLQGALSSAAGAATARDDAFRAALQQVLVRAAAAEHDAATLRAADASARLGSLAMARTGAYHVAEVWEDGPALRDLSTRMSTLARQREGVEAARKALRRRLPGPGQSVSHDADCTPEEFVAREEVLRVRLTALKREEEACRQERERLEAEKLALARELKRLRDQDGSRWRGSPLLHGRYVLGNMLGRGGFSEVFRAYDLQALEFVALKVHQVNPGWSEVKKQAYVRHAVRECSIHKDLHHPCIVALHDIFEIDAETFATVLELCEGGDLEGYLRERGSLPEREARAIVARVLAGLAYLNRPGRRIIHYDLKPGNILFDDVGEVKITDFGLSKVMEEGHTQLGTELTSQGAGTYWYLPPECFQTSATQPPRITNKVDVWSVGVVFFQLLYGRRPFGEGLSQEHILRNNVMLHATQVQFPAKPAVSQEAKDFISRCLAYRVEDRMDVLEAAAHPYMAAGGVNTASKGGRGRQSPAGGPVGDAPPLFGNKGTSQG